MLCHGALSSCKLRHTVIVIGFFFKLIRIKSLVVFYLVELNKGNGVVYQKFNQINSFFLETQAYIME